MNAQLRLKAASQVLRGSFFSSRTFGLALVALPATARARLPGPEQVLALARGLAGQVLAWRRHWALLAILVAVVATYAPSLNDYFHGDDFIAFQDLTTKPFFKHMGEVFTFQDSNIYWRPLAQLYHRIVYGFAGLDPFAFHLANLIVFLITLVLLYLFCLREGFGVGVATAAVAIFGLYPNHPVSIAWIDNVGRELSLTFILGSLLALQRAVRTSRPRDEALAVALFLVAVLCDETTLALAPVPVLYGAYRDWGGTGFVRRQLRRGAAYGAILATLGPLQFIMDSQNSTQGAVNDLALGPNVVEHFWALVSRLTLPLASGDFIRNITGAEWVVGAIAIALAVLMLAFGSMRLRFLVLWGAFALAPFSLWTLPIVPGRYVYLAAPAFAIVVAWCGGQLFHAVTGAMAASSRPAALASRGVLWLGAATALVLMLGSSVATEVRDHQYGEMTSQYRLLGVDLPKLLPQVPKGGRVIIYYGPWRGYPIWTEAVVRTVYKDPSLQVVNVIATDDESPAPSLGPKDRVVYYTGRGFILPVLRASANN